MAATMSDWAALGSLQNDNLDAAAQISNAVTITLVGNALWAGLFFFWGIGFLTLGTALVMQRKLNVIVDWIFVVFGALFVILLLMPWDLAQNVGFLIFGIMGARHSFRTETPSLSKRGGLRSENETP